MGWTMELTAVHNSLSLVHNIYVPIPNESYIGNITDGT